MSPIQFIHGNVKRELEKQGYAATLALIAADMAVDHYRRCSKSSKKGSLFEDCMRVGKAWIEKMDSKPKGS
ncbi:hypothetical protein ACJW8F_15580 [Plesiomonas shigelloides]|uniref:hypothetical protein n=1 Tax=Plesiomonas shigelloides TaxID=703 RepID=UPI00387EF745